MILLISWLVCCKYKKLTNALRGTANAWHFPYALICVSRVLCGKLVVALAAP
ncbi:DUF3265 domain-containing protein [Vibrio cholerae]|nr:DUF3265 domain-containing protein [Vibrio cholerae]